MGLQYSNHQLNKPFKKTINNSRTHSDSETTISSHSSNITVQNSVKQNIVPHISSTERNYTQDLSKNITLNPELTTVNNNIFIYDWDDTLLCTSYLMKTGHRSLSSLTSKERNKFNTIENHVNTLLQSSLSKGSVYIITNSEQGWVEHSCSIFYPQISALLTSSEIKIISARSKYQKKYPGENKKWKTWAFSKIIKNLNLNYLANIIIVGDSSIEIEAGKVINEEYKTAVIKTVKFRNKPDLREWSKELLLITTELTKIYSLPKSLEINVDSKKRENNV